MKEESIAVVITNYNSWPITQRCVEQCLKHDADRIGTLLVYDDCSTVRLRFDFPMKVKTYFAKTNLGLTKSLNLAVRLTSEEIVVIFDSDAFPTTPFCRAILRRFSENAELGLLGMPTIGSDGRRTESYSTEPNVWGILLGQQLSGKFSSWIEDRSGRLSVFTCAMAVRRQAFEAVGGFDEHFDWLDLDHDFSMRMNRSQWKVDICGNVVVFHEGGGTSQLTRNRVLRHYKNRWYLLRKFQLVPAPQMIWHLIEIRLGMEYFILRLFGRILFKDPIMREDKLVGRKELLHFWRTVAH